MRTGAPAAGIATAASTSAARRRPMRRSLALAAAPGQVFSDTLRRFDDARVRRTTAVRVDLAYRRLIMSIIPSLTAELRGGCPTPRLGRSPGVARISGKGQVRIFGTRTECRHPEPESSANLYPDFSRVSPCAAAYDTLSTSAHGERLNAARPGRWPTAGGRTPPRGLLWGSHDMRTPPRRSPRANPNRLCGTRRSLPHPRAIC